MILDISSLSLAWTLDENGPLDLLTAQRPLFALSLTGCTLCFVQPCMHISLFLFPLSFPEAKAAVIWAAWMRCRSRARENSIAIKAGIPFKAGVGS